MEENLFGVFFLFFALIERTPLLAQYEKSEMKWREKARATSKKCRQINVFEYMN